MATVYDKLLQLPLFQGLTLKNFTNILGKVTFHFDNCEPDTPLAEQGELCKRLTFILDGTVTKRTRMEGTVSMMVEETFSAPYIFELSSLFGKDTIYRSSYLSATKVSTMVMHKRFLLEELNAYPIVDMNYRNIMSAQVQELSRRLWSAPAPTAEGRLAAFFLNHVERAEGEKVFYIQKADLASFTNESFSKITSTLAALQNQGLLTYFRGVLTIPDAAKLLELIHPTENQQGI